MNFQDFNPTLFFVWLPFLEDDRCYSSRTVQSYEATVPHERACPYEDSQTDAEVRSKRRALPAQLLLLKED